MFPQEKKKKKKPNTQYSFKTLEIQLQEEDA